MAHTVLTILLVLSAGSFGFSARSSVDDEKFVALTKTFEEWITNHGSSYSSELEKAQRLKIFSDNLDYINKHNAQPNTTYKLGLNKFSDLTNEEFRAKYTMKTPGAQPSTLSPTTKTAIDLSSAPSSLDWRQKGAVTAIKDQGNCGCCWAFSAAAAIESAHFLATRMLVSVSEQQLLDCTYPGNDGCAGGLAKDAFTYVIKNGGITTEKDYPYKQAAGVCQSPEGGVKIRSYVDVEQRSEDALMQAVIKTPVSVRINGADPKFQQYKTGIFNNANCGSELNHEVLAIGYGTSDGIPYWIIKNSWGSTWGDGGYGKIVRTGDQNGMCGMNQNNWYPIV